MSGALLGGGGSISQAAAKIGGAPVGQAARGWAAKGGVKVMFKCVMCWE